MSSNGNGNWRFGDFELDCQAGSLARGGRALKIQPQPLRVLEILVESHGEIVSREELRSRVWGDNTFVEFDQGLNYCIRQIRLALGDDAGAPVYLETLPKRGYRFIAPVEGNRRDHPDPLTSNVVAADPQDRPGRNHRKTRILSAVFGAVLLLAGIAWLAARGINPAPLEVAGVTQIAPFPGNKHDPAFSPDGVSLAFSWAGENGDSPGIYVIPSGGGEPRRLTQAPNSDISPAWAPDGRRIAFLRRQPGQDDELMIVASAGGEARKLRDIRMPELLERRMRPILAWTPDGSGIVFPMNDQETGSASLFRIDSEGSATRPFVRAHGGLGNSAPAFSPDGKTFVYWSGDLRILRIGTNRAPLPGEERVLGPGRSPVWSPDGSVLLYVGGPRIMAWSSHTNSAQTLYVAPGEIQAITARWVAHDLPEVVASIDGGQPEIHALALRNGRVVTGAARLPLRAASVPTFSRDGRWIVFASLDDVRNNLWMADTEGHDARQITFEGEVDRGYWSPDGKHFAFHVAPLFRDYVADIDPDELIRKPQGVGPTIRPVAKTPFGMMGPDWSPDQKYLYATRPGATYRIMRVPSDGGEVEDLFEGDGVRIEPAGRRIFYGKGGIFGLFARSLDGDVRLNPEERVISDFVAPRGFDVNSRGIYYLGRNSARKPVAIRFFDFSLRKSFDIAPAPLGLTPSIAISPDSKRLLYDTLSDSVGSLALMKFVRRAK